EHQPYLFEQFSRAENAMQEFTEGTGLGLYMVKLLLEKIGGTIACSSKLHVGTTFIISIPSF
ncbi:MAG: ATP-binding protein, partial [bacterium]|nr:ATP-binding protein [bacterium]